MQRYRAGSDTSADGGRKSELSEWQRSIADEGFLKPRKISGTTTGRGSNKKKGFGANSLSGQPDREMTLDSSANHSVNQGSFHEVVGFRHLRNLSFCGI